jgi:hypothetical protein
MGNFTRNFLAGRMNKVVDQRLLPESEYVDAMNIRMGSTEKSEVGVITNTKGNLPLTQLSYIDGTPLSPNARCIGAIDDSANETIYWFVHDPTFTVGATGKLDLIVSYNVLKDILKYHVISIDDGGGIDTTLNFNSTYLITGVSLIDKLIFFTDDYNPPRFINVRPTSNRYPNPISDIDQVSAEALLVIKKPPIESPTVTPIITSGQENFLETRFICFAYRYRYVDGEYSATSQWSEPAFIPQPFEFSKNSMLNEGMVNSCNAAIINYNSGGPLVVGIDLLFKESNKNIIKIIEKLDKADLGIGDNQVYPYSFNNSKIFTVLNEAEILRLYDNVPRVAKAQTIMGNRLMYGNYVEGYDLVDKNKVPVKFEYTTSLTSESIGQISIPDSTDNGIYNIDPTALGQTIAASIMTFDLTGINLIAGSSITITMTIAHSTFTGSLPFPTETTGFLDLDFVFNLSTSYSSVYALATSAEFTQAIGTITNIKPVYSPIPGTETSCDGNTLTDQFNCFLPNNLNTFIKYGSGINAILQPVKIITTPASNIIGLQIPAMEYVDSLTTPTKRVYEYFDFTFAKVIFQEISNPTSLHSNRGYEIGIVYMDEFNRSTTALVSTNNAEFTPCGTSASKNTIQVTIPPTQIAPYWATRYKFVIKPDAENYETIYSNIFFNDPDSNDVWFLMEGENTKKVEKGDRLIVKADTSGPTTNCTYATILDKQAQPTGFITPKGGAKALAGLYIKMNPNSFNIVVDPNAVIAPGFFSPLEYAGIGDHSCPPGYYPMNLARAAGFDPVHPSWTYEDYTIPSGSRIKMYINGNRYGTGSSCECNVVVLDNQYVSSRDYDNMEDWFNGDNIAATLDNPAISQCGGATMKFMPGHGAPGCGFNTVYLRFNRNTTTNQLVLGVSTGWACSGIARNNRRFFVDMEVIVYRAINTIIWETEPSDALPDVFFENNLSFAIDSNGYHDGNIQNQTSVLPAIIDTGFYNCFSFGNGAESYKIRDSLIGKSFNLGERVTTVAAQDYKAADRFSDITYSGIYNGESNINKLNEFNAGLLNFKHCEGSFGEIQYLDGRNTDILTLQEDKISYVLAEKNLLSDASAGGIITSTPMVLGTQIARTEKYGISFNPESYVQWGYDRFFTDAKRGVVIQLKGGEDQNEQLTVLSDQNMRTWFRDKFNESFNFQKLGGFDPYMNEYVLSMNDQQLPINPQCLPCGMSQTFTLSVGVEASKTQIYCVDLGPTVGYTNINWTFTNIESGKTLDVSVLYDGTTVSSGPISTDGNITFHKDNISVETAQITLTYTGDMVVSVTADCCEAEILNIVEVVLTNNTEAGKTIHTQYRYTNGIFVGPLLSNLVQFISDTASPVVSRYNITTGLAGQGGFPPEFSTMRLISNAIVPDDFVFNTTYNKFRYLRSNTLYDNNNIDIQSMLYLSTIITPISGSAPVYNGDFTVPSSLDGSYLYLIWDLRSAIETELCYGTTRINSCCDCIGDVYYLDASFNAATSVWSDDTLTTFAANGFYSVGGIVRELVDGILLPQQTCRPCAVEVSLCFGISSFDVCCACNVTCSTPSGTYLVSNTVSGVDIQIFYYDENGILTSNILPYGSVDVPYCSIGLPFASNNTIKIAVVFDYCGCGT